MNYYPAQGAVKCNFFTLILTEATMTWLNTLGDGSVDSLNDLVMLLPPRLPPESDNPRPWLCLAESFNENKETIRKYIDNFIKVALAMGGTCDVLNC